jgi:hypothetical protein
MRTLRFGRKLKLPSTIAIKHQIKKLMAEDKIKRTQSEASSKAAHVDRIVAS